MNKNEIQLEDNFEVKIQNFRKSGFPKVWVADQGDGTYVNPIIHADYSDPDVIAVGDDFYMVASSFNCVPGFPILHSKDLVNWTLINYIISEVPFKEYEEVQHGKAVWAPSIRFYDGYFWVYVGMPDEGIFMSRTDNIYGQWEPLHCVKQTRGWIDTCPFWDDDGTMYLVNGFAKSRIGFKSVLGMSKLTSDGRSVTDEFRIVFDGNANHPTIEGPKLYKRNGYYYISAPAGGVETGYQVILRSTNIYGPYEDKIVLHQGKTQINGPHQGGWVETSKGEFWFIHFQDKGAYGRIIHLQPMYWENDWPVMGIDQNKKGIGEPVIRFRKPDVNASSPILVPATSDDFEEKELGLQWQWHANPSDRWHSLEEKSVLRLYSNYIGKNTTLWNVPNQLLQKFPALQFNVTAKMDVSELKDGDLVGLVVMGLVYKGIFIEALKDSINSFGASKNIKILAIDGEAEAGVEAYHDYGVFQDNSIVYLQCNVNEFCQCEFLFGFNGIDFTSIGSFSASKGRWIGAKFGLTVINQSQVTNGYAKIDWIIVEEVE